MKLFNEYIKLIEAYCGLRFPETHFHYIREAVANEMKNRNITEEQYLLTLWENNQERDNFFDKITINETYMFREERHFHLLKKILESSKMQSEKNVLLWSVTCSTGEEAISLALVAEEYIKKPNCYSIYATDINSRSIEHLRTGVILNTSLRFDGTGFSNLIEKYTIASGNNIEVKPEILHKIFSFKKNLLSDIFSEILDSSVHIAFFRNTLVYMDESVKQKMVTTVVSKIKEGGYLFLSSPEVPLIQHPELRIEEEFNCYYFRKGKIPLISETNTNQLPQLNRKKEILVRNIASLPKNTLDIKEVFSILNKEVEIKFPTTQNINFTVASQIQKALVNIHKLELQGAQSNIVEIEKNIPDHEIIYFLKGLYYYSEGNIKPAIQNFELSTLTNSSLWMSSFYLGLILKQESPEKALKNFKTALKFIEQEKQKNKFLYSFLMDNFDIMYFIRTCQNWIFKLSSNKG